MAKSYKYDREKYNNYKLILFIFFIFPYLMYTYSSTIPMLYFSNIILITLILLFLSFTFLCFKNNIDIGNEKSYFIFLLCILLLTVFTPSNLSYTLKYISFTIIYFLLFKQNYTEKYWYKLYVNLVSFITVVVLYVVFLHYALKIGKSFDPNDIKLFLSNKSALLNRDWGYIVPFYAVVIAEHMKEGILGVQRILGVSHEPTAFATILLPAFFLSLEFRKYFSLTIITLGILFTSSYGSFLFILIGLMFIVFYKHKKLIWIIGFIISLIILLFSNIIYNYAAFISPRIALYSQIFMNFMNQKVHLVQLKQFQFHGKGSIDVPAIFDILLNYGLIAMMLYGWILYSIVSKAEKFNNKIIYGMVIAMILMTNKGQLALSPLFFFIVNYLNIKDNKV